MIKKSFVDVFASAFAFRRLPSSRITDSARFDWEHKPRWLKEVRDEENTVLVLSFGTWFSRVKLVNLGIIEHSWTDDDILTLYTTSMAKLIQMLAKFRGQVIFRSLTVPHKHKLRRPHRGATSASVWLVDVY